MRIKKCANGKYKMTISKNEWWSIYKKSIFVDTFPHLDVENLECSIELKRALKEKGIDNLIKIPNSSDTNELAKFLGSKRLALEVEEIYKRF